MKKSGRYLQCTHCDYQVLSEEHANSSDKEIISRRSSDEPTHEIGEVDNVVWDNVIEDEY
ncbi:MAG: hypothetical protein KKB04_04490 [Candidatus Thermoplasmatota archaeon]|nr:hypothetical protein [Candidatus Thermoplasmatota archaeon]